MNCPSRVDPEALPNGWNQNPDHFATQTASDTNATSNKATLRGHRIDTAAQLDAIDTEIGEQVAERDKAVAVLGGGGGGDGAANARGEKEGAVDDSCTVIGDGDGSSPSRSGRAASRALFLPSQIKKVLTKYIKFVGPGWMVSIAYIDPGNYATDVAAGSSYRFRLLVMILVSNVIAIFLQALCVKLGSVTGLNLAEMCKKHCPTWLNIVLFLFAEAAIIATDMAEVIGSAVALNLLLHIPIVAGCAISVLDVLIILLFYRPSGSMRGVRVFECFVALLVLGVVICFAIELSLIPKQNLRELFRGYLPSSALIERNGLLQACGILGATVMPHSLYLGSGIVQPRLYEYDEAHNNLPANTTTSDTSSDSSPEKYRPSLSAIRFCLKYSIIDLSISLFVFALFVNSAILIVAGASLSGSSADQANLFGIFNLLSTSIGKPAGIIFALALLLSGISAGIVCTIAGQIVWLGQINMPLKPWVQRLLTRSIAITPSIIIAGAVGKDGISAALEGTQIALSVILPVVSAPLIWFTCRAKYMTVPVSDGSGPVNMRNHWITATVAIALWLMIVLMNVASWVLQGKGS